MSKRLGCFAEFNFRQMPSFLNEEHEEFEGGCLFTTGLDRESLTLYPETHIRGHASSESLMRPDLVVRKRPTNDIIDKRGLSEPRRGGGGRGRSYAEAVASEEMGT